MFLNLFAPLYFSNLAKNLLRCFQRSEGVKLFFVAISTDFAENMQIKNNSMIPNAFHFRIITSSDSD